MKRRLRGYYLAKTASGQDFGYRVRLTGEELAALDTVTVGQFSQSQVMRIVLQDPHGKSTHGEYLRLTSMTGGMSRSPSPPDIENT